MQERLHASTFPGFIAMAITFVSRQDAAPSTDKQVKPTSAPASNTAAVPAQKPKATHTKRRPYDRANLLKPGRLKTGEMLDLYGVSHSTFYQYRGKGIVPEPDGHILNRPYWLTSTIAPHFVGTQPAQTKG